MKERGGKSSVRLSNASNQRRVGKGKSNCLKKSEVSQKGESVVVAERNGRPNVVGDIVHRGRSKKQCQSNQRPQNIK